MMLDGKRLRLHGGISSIESIRTLGTRSVETHGSISCLTRHNDNDEPCWKAWDQYSARQLFYEENNNINWTVSRNDGIRLLSLIFLSSSLLVSQSGSPRRHNLLDRPPTRSGSSPPDNNVPAMKDSPAEADNSSGQTGMYQSFYHLYLANKCHS